MADNITAPGAGAVLATDEIAGVHYPKTKLVHGAADAAQDVTTAQPLPVRDMVLEAALANQSPARTLPGKYSALDTQRIACDIVQTLPTVSGATFVLVQAEAQNIRYVMNGDGDTPAAANFGMLLYTGQPPIILAPTDLTKIEFIGVANGAFLNVTFCQ